MSELTKHSLTSIGTNKKEKQGKKVKRTVRFELSLLESNEQAYSQLNYKDLLISREKRDRQKSKERGEGLQNGFGDVASAEDAEMVRRLEEKYGNAEVSGKKKKTKRGRFENFADLGAGYDETDPFIDNTDAYDEVVPEQMTTAHGGFYINCGPLEFKQMSDQSDIEEPVNKIKRRTKRVMSILEEEEDEDEDKSDCNMAKKTKADVVEENADIAKKRKLSLDLQLLKKKKKHAIEELTKKKTATVKELLKEKRDTLEIAPVVAPPEGKKLTLGGDTVIARTSITDAIESVVNGAMEDDTSQDSTASQGSKSTAVSLPTTDSDVSQDPDEEKNALKEEMLLPDNLPEDLKELISGLQKAGKTPAEGKCKFFTMEVNKMLLGVERICYTLTSNSRNLVYKYLESYLPCTKDTLMKRAKKLNIKNKEDKIKKLLAKLKADVDAVMPAILENYGLESQRVVQEKSVEELPSDTEDKPGSVKSRIPRKVFPWTKELQSLVLDIIEIKTCCLVLSKTRKESVERNLQTFLDKEVKTLWPAGWMSVPKLLKLKNKKTGARKPPKQVSFATLPVASTVPGTLNLNISVTTASIAAAAVPTNTASISTSAASVSSSAASVTWSKSSTTITAINSFPSITSHTNGVQSQASAAYSQSTAMSLSVSTSNFPSVKCSPPLDKPVTNHSKSNTSVDKFSSKISDIPNSISRTTTVIVPNSPSKNTSPELASVISSSSVLETSSQMSLANIPDCISVMPAVSLSQTTSANISPPKPMSLKHRILHDAAIDLTNCTKLNLLVADSAVEALQGGLPVNKVSKDVNMFETVPESHKNDLAAKLKPPRRKKKEAKEFVPELQPEHKAEPPPPPQPQACEKESERRLLEETNAAASFINQIINESLQSFPNASTIRSNSICHNPPSPACSPPKEALPQDNFGLAFQSDFGQSKPKKKIVERRPSSADSEILVQREVNRVLEELKELQGLSVGKTESAEGDYSSRSSLSSLPVHSSPHMNSLGTSIPKLNVDSLLNSNPLTSKRSSMAIGFQDEFQKHISQIKQDKAASLSSVGSYPQVSQPSVGLHSTIRHTPSADSSQSRNSNGSDITPSYLKQSVSSDPFAGLLFGGVQARNLLNSHFQDKSYDQSGLGVLPGMPNFNPNLDDPFTMSPYGMKTDAGKNQHSSPC